MAPKIFFVPGFWEGPSVFDPLSSLLITDGFTTETAVLPSTGTSSPGNPTMKDDIAAVRQQMEHVISQGDEILLVLHSAGGFIGSEAMEGLSKHQRQRQGHNGGVIGIIFIAGAVFPKGHQHQPLPCAIVEGGASYCIQPENLLFNDIPEEEKVRWLAELKPQPAQGWDSVVSYTGWEDVSSVYLVCEGDNLLPASLQEQLATLASSKIERCSGGHVAQLSQPQRVMEVIKTALDSFS